MSISDQIKRISDAKASIKTAIENKGVDVPDNALIDSYASYIDNIEVGSGEGGGSGDNYYEKLWMQKTNNGTDMSYAFYNRNNEIDFTGLDTSKVTNAACMFYNFTNGGKYIDMSQLDFSNVINSQNMFAYCNTDIIDVKNLNIDISKLGSGTYYTSYFELFYETKGTVLDLSSWDVSNAIKIQYLFKYCNCKTINLTNWITTNATMMSNLFYSSKVEELIIPDWDMTNTTSTSSMFSNCSKLIKVDLSRSNDVTITKIASLLPTKTSTTPGSIYIPYNTSQDALDALTAKYWVPVLVGGEDEEGDTPEVTANVIEFKISKSNYEDLWDDDILVRVNNRYIEKMDSRITYDSNTEICRFETGEAITSLSFFNTACTNTVEEVILSTNDLTDAEEIFCSCRNLEKVDMSACDFSKITNTTDMFYSCTNLTELIPPTNISCDLDLGSTNLQVSSLCRVLRNLAEVDDCELILPYNGTYSTLSDLHGDLLDAAQAKGWNVYEY